SGEPIRLPAGSPCGSRGGRGSKIHARWAALVAMGESHVCWEPCRRLQAFARTSPVLADPVLIRRRPWGATDSGRLEDVRPSKAKDESRAAEIAAPQAKPPNVRRSARPAVTNRSLARHQTAGWFP